MAGAGYLVKLQRSPSYIKGDTGILLLMLRTDTYEESLNLTQGPGVGVGVAVGVGVTVATTNLTILDPVVNPVDQ
jgi:hypothetical protein